MLSLLFESSFYSFAFYVAINALIMLVLGILVTRARMNTQTPIGDGGGRPDMAGPLRAHGNNTEYVPMALLLMWVLCLPAIGGSIWLIHGVGAPLTIGRILHAIGLSRSIGPTPLRLIGMVLTWIAYIVGIVGVLYLVFSGISATFAAAAAS
ncbi:MAG: MAPEG family protein [Rhizomicrobium sp.]|jgi:hypothetical protein